jgi:hypothetical protein
MLLMALAARPVTAEEDSAMSLAVRIVPTRYTEPGGRVITLFDPADHFSVVLTNVGRDPLRLWRESCSWGYFNLTFEATDEQGTRVTVAKTPRDWNKNFPDWTILAPGDHMVIEVTFDRSTWRDAPLPEPGQQRTVSLRAIYEIPEDDETKSNNLWTGRVASPETTYTLFR